MIESFIDLLASSFSSGFNDFFSLFLLLSAAYCFVRYDLLGLRRLTGCLGDACGRLDNIKTGSVVSMDEFNWIFTFRKHKVLGEIWRDYHSDYQTVSQNQKSLNLQDYFNMSSVLTIPACRKQADAAPGVIIALGILGTLVSLLVGIKSIGPAAASKGINALLHTFRSALGILVLAILVSVIYQVIDKWLYQKAAGNALHFLALMERKIPQAGTVGYFETLMKEQQKQIDRIENVVEDAFKNFTHLLNNGLVNALSKSLEGAVRGLVAPHVESISNNVNRLSEISLANQSEVIQKIVDNFVKNLGQALNSQLRTLGDNIKASSDSLETTRSNMDVLIQELIKNSTNQKDINSASEQIVEAIARYQQDITEGNTNLAQTLENMGEFSSVLTEMLEANKQLLEKMCEQQLLLTQENSRYISDMSDMMLKTQVDIDIRTENVLSRFTDITSEALNRMETGMIGTIEGFVTHSGTILENMDMQVRNLGTYAHEIAEEIDELNDNLKDSVTEFKEQIHGEVEKTFSDFDQGLSDICLRLSYTIDKIRDSIDDLPQFIDAIRGKATAVRENEQ